MATRYWVGGTGTWDASSTTHWSASSGGASGASVPGATDDVVFDGSSGGGTVTTSSAPAIKSLTTTGFSGTIQNDLLSVKGSVIIGSGTTVTAQVNITGTGNLSGTLNATLGIGSSAVVTLTGNLVCSGSFNVANTSTFNAGAYNVFAQSFSGNDTCTVNMGSGTWTLSGTGSYPWAWYGGTLNKQTASMVFSGNGSRTMRGGGQAYPSVTVQGSTAGQNFNIEGNNTFDALNSSIAVAHSIRFSPGSSQTIKAMSNVASAGNLQTLTISSGVTPATLTYSGSDRIGLDYLSLSYITAAPANSFYAGTHSTDGGNNSGWVFTDPPPRSGLFFGATF